MIRNLQVLAIALVVSSASLIFAPEKEVDETVQIGKSVVGDDGTKKAPTPGAAKAKMKPGKEKKVYVGKSHEAGKKPADMGKEKKRGGFLSRILGRGNKNSADEDNPRKK